MSLIPDDAAHAVSRIEAMLDEARRLIEQGGVSDEAAFSIYETQRRYLPDTLRAYLDVPASQRDAITDELLIDQLGLLERATAGRLASLAEAGRSNLAANGAFLAERFSGESLPETVHATDLPVPPAGATPRALVARLFSDFALARGVPIDAAQTLERAGQRFAGVFPALTTVRRGLFGGPVKGVYIDVPLRGDVLRYALESERGGVSASCTKLVRGVALRTERTDVGSWMNALLEDMTAYVETDRSARDLLTTLLSG